MRQEISNKRTLNSKTFSNDDGTFTLESHVGHIHHKDKITGELKDIDTTLINKGTYWEMKKAGYEVELPQKSNGILKFFANNEGINFVHLKVDGQPIKVVDGVQTKPNQITYSEVLPNIDLRLSAGYNSFRKEVVIKQKPIFTGDFYELEFQQNTSFIGKEKGRKFKIGNIHFSPARIWDSQGDSIDIEFDFQTNKLIKRIPREFLENAVYPVVTDTTTSYYTGAGDGYVRARDAWDTAHDATSGALVDYTGTDPTTNASLTPTPDYQINRSFWPVDTSALDSGAIISAATFYNYIVDTYDTTGGANGFVTVVQTTQPNHTVLALADYDLCGAVDAPTEGVDAGDRLDLTGLTANSWVSWVLNATGRGWIKKSGQASTCGTALTGWTCLGLRIGFDTNDVVPTGTGQNSIISTSSEGAANDPYLSVTYTLPTNYTQSITEAIILVDTISRIEQGFRQIITDIITLVDGGITLIYKMGVLITETIILIDTRDIRSYFRQTITDIIILVDSGVSSGLHFYTTITDAISINDIIHIPGTWWSWITKHTTSWTHQSKNTTTWTNQSKNSSTWTFQNKSDL